MATSVGMAFRHARFIIKKNPSPAFAGDGYCSGDDLLSQDLSSHYHRRCGVSLPGSEWDRVVPPRSGHQRAIEVPVDIVSLAP